MDSLYAFKCKHFRNTRHTVTIGIGLPVSQDARRVDFRRLRSKLTLSCSIHKKHIGVWVTWMAHRSSGHRKIIVPRVNCEPTGRFLTILSAKYLLNLCSSRLRFFEQKHTTSMFCTYESSHLEFNCQRFRYAGIGSDTTMCIKPAGLAAL
jgi:hypothetical protein